MNMLLFYLGLAIAVLDWVAVARGWKTVELIAKPATMIALLAWLALNGGLNWPLLWFWLGLAFSLAGDIFLLPQVDRFIGGLVAFLVGHLCYLIGLNQSAPPLGIPTLILAVLVLATAFIIYRRVATGLVTSGHAALKLPVLTYTLVISLMLLSALTTLVRPDWRFSEAALVAAGAFLFFLSDAVLAWNKFVAPLPNGRLINMSTYHLGQFLIALGAALHYA